MSHQPDPVPGILASIADIEADLQILKITVANHLIPQADRILELENMANPYSSCGQAVCNYNLEDDYE